MGTDEIVAIVNTAISLNKAGKYPGSEEFDEAIRILTKALCDSTGEKIDEEFTTFALYLAACSVHTAVSTMIEEAEAEMMVRQIEKEDQV